jgi:hypothetical protein
VKPRFRAHLEIFKDHTGAGYFDDGAITACAAGFRTSELAREDHLRSFRDLPWSL